MGTLDEASPDFWEPSRAQIWRRDLVSRAVDVARRELAARAKTNGRPLLDNAEQRLRERRSSSLRGELERYAFAVAGLEIAAAEGPSQSARARLFYLEATRCLRRVGIGRRGSRLSELHGVLLETARSVTPGGVAPWELAADASPPAALRDLFDGGPEFCLRLLERELACGPATGASPALGLAQVRLLRLSGRFQEARAKLDRLGGAVDAGAVDADAREWELLAVGAMEAGSAGELLASVRRGAVVRNPARMLELFLWSRASKTKAHMGELPAVSSLRRSAGSEAGSEGSSETWRIALILERAYKSSLPLSSRVASVLRAAERVDAVSDPAWLMLSIGACARWLSRFKQPEESAKLAARYRALCLSASDGRDADVFRLALESNAEQLAAGSSAHGRASANPPAYDSSLFRLGVGLVKTKFRSFDSSDDELDAYVEVLAYHLSALKGPVMKLGQILSFYGAPIPEESRALLSALQDDAAPLAFSSVKGVLEAELGRRAGDVFAELEEEALSTGSVGQVHRGRLRSGERVVVKIQFPGIRERMERDFRALRLLLPLASRFFPRWDLPGIVDELRAQMLLECDYRNEAAWQAKFRRRLADDDRIVVPRVHDELTTARVLVSDYFEGQTFSEFARTAPQATRDRAGETIVRYAIRSTVVDRSFNTDMHPGNLLFSDDKVCLVDFGNVREWNDAGARGWREMLTGVVREDKAMVLAAVRLLGIVPSDRAEPLDDDLYELMTKLLMGVLAEDRPARISKETLLSEMLQFLPSHPEAASRLLVPPTYVYAFRMYWGMFAILSDLGACVRFRALTVAALERRGP
jgi:predicted unusual protein kinase regulating ubiquinone biosynthesis (AarF/ABC1/UbiB family)